MSPRNPVSSFLQSRPFIQISPAVLDEAKRGSVPFDIASPSKYTDIRPVFLLSNVMANSLGESDESGSLGKQSQPAVPLSLSSLSQRAARVDGKCRVQMHYIPSRTRPLCTL